MPRLRIRSLDVPPPISGWVLTDLVGRPRFWAAVWEGILSKGQEGTTARHLANIEQFYRSAHATLGDDLLDQAIAERDFNRLEACLTAYLSKLRNDAVRRRVDLSDPWKSALRFVTDVVRHLGAEEAHRVEEIEARLGRLDALYSQVAPTKKKAALPIRALPAIVVEDLCEVLDPESSRNPFNSEAIRQRNYLLYIFYLSLGLRRGEALMLSANAIKTGQDLRSGKDYRWLNVTTLEGQDPRYVKPGLKTAQSQRQIPVTQELVTLFDAYVASYRPHTRFGYLFLSQKRSPLATQSVNDAFRIATMHLSPEAKRSLEDRGWSKIPDKGDCAAHASKTEQGGKRWLSPHDLRHTSVVVKLKQFIDQGYELEEALGKLRVFFGWSYESDMPMHYARAYWQTDVADQIESRFDRFVDALRDVDTSLYEHGAT